MTTLNQLPLPPTAQEIDLVWLMNNREVLADYMAVIYALSNAQIAVTQNGKTTLYPVRISPQNAVTSFSV